MRAMGTYTTEMPIKSVVGIIDLFVAETITDPAGFSVQPCALCPKNCCLPKFVRIMEVEFLLDARSVGFHCGNMDVHVLGDLPRTIATSNQFEYPKFSIGKLVNRKGWHGLNLGNQPGSHPQSKA